MPEICNEPEAIHGWFGLTYSNYLVLPRTLLQSMPDEWQNRFVACLNEMSDAFSHVQQAEGYVVKSAVEREVVDLSDEELALVGYSKGEDDDGLTCYHDERDNEVESWHRVMLPAGHDPVPHYSRGRTYIQPHLPAGVPDGA